ncbi:MAG: N-acetylneuraminate synthase family protein [Kiritimatiellae bacterium]|nr:N-acetylneuraminate synthase family protein [Kiritimatiellia bacterium]
MKIGAFDTEKSVLVVAEIGNNHEGSFDVAQALVRKAAACGVDAVKVQAFDTAHYVSGRDPNRFARLKSFELSGAQFEALGKLAHASGLLFLATPFDLGSAARLEHVVDGYKIASSDNDFFPLIAAVARTGKPLLVSSGVSDLSRVADTVEFVRGQWAENAIDGQLGVLHCVSCYPVPAEQANLRSIPCLADHLDCTVGYSDHTTGIEAAVLAVGLGAEIVEKHFTLDKAFSDFRDHQLSADPAELAELVRRVRLASALLGERTKTVLPCEEGVAAAIRRSIVAARALPKGHRLTTDDLTWIRPADGLRVGQEQRLLGRRLTRDVSFGDRLLESDVE